jgi:hypothetical protein
VLVILASTLAGACSRGSADGGTGTAPTSLPVSQGGGIEMRLRSEQLMVPLGEPAALILTVVNTRPRSESLAITLAVRSPLGDTVDAVETSVFASFNHTMEIPVAFTPAQWFEELGIYQVFASAVGDDVTVTPAATVVEVIEPTVLVPEFEDVTESAGVLTSVPEAQCGQFSNGAAFADVDGDADQDLLVTRLGEPLQLFVNDGDGHFGEDGAARGLAAPDANGVAFADYDNDADQDVIVVADGPDRLYANDGTGHFSDVSAAAGIGAGDSARGMDAAWGDYDGDGFVDLFVTNYMRCTGAWDTEEQIIANVEYDRDVLYHNEGDGTFAITTQLLEGDLDEYDDGNTIGAGFGAQWFDYDGDGRMDLYLANDFVGPAPDSNRLWRNDGADADGTWRFTDVSLDSGTAFYINTMGIGVADVDRNDTFDMALSNVGASKLVRNSGDGTFVDDVESGIGRPTVEADRLSITWGTTFADFNLDGWDDLYMAAGNFMQPPEVRVGAQSNVLYVSDGTGQRWLDVSAATGADDAADSKGVAVADFDRDGLVDLFVVNQAGNPRLLRNVTPVDGLHWLGVRLRGTESNRDGCGAVIRLELPDGVIAEPVLCGSGGGGSGSEPVVHIGLGEVDHIDRLVIEWPSGSEQIVSDVAVDRYATFEEQL